MEALTEQNRITVAAHNPSPVRSMTIESRIERIETMMETFLSMQPGMSVEPSSRASAEPEQVGGDGMDYQGPYLSV